MRKFLALVLSLGLVWGPLSPAAVAQVITRGAAPVVAPIPAGIGASATSLSHSVTFSPTAASPLAMPALPGSIGLTPAVPTADQATVSAAKAYAPAVAAVTPAAPASLASVERHPALGLIADLQKAGGDALLSQLDAAKSPADFEAVAMALPEGAARASVQSFAKSLAAQNFGAGADSIGALYDNARRSDLRPSADAPKAEGFWAKVAGWHMPRPLASLRRYALKKAEESRPKAKLVDLDALKVPVERLRWTPDQAALPERASKAERGARKVVGQDRALESLEFGLKIEDPGYNVIVTGAEGTGRETAVRELLKEIAPNRPTPGDVVAAVNFGDTDSPVILRMPAGEGKGFVEAVSDAVERVPELMGEALSKGPVAKARKQVKAQLEANIADREKAFQREASRVQVAGGLGIEVGAQQTDETHIGIVSALTKDGVRVKPEDLDKALEGTGVTKDQVMADFQAKARPLIEKYAQILQTNMQEQAQAQAQLQMLEQKVAGNVISEAVGPLAALAGGAAEREEDAGHVAWRESAKARMEAWQEKVAGLRVAGLFSVSIGQGVTLLFKGQPVSQKSFEALKAEGQVPATLTWDALVKQALAAVQPLAAEVQALQEAIEAEHQKLHENDPPVSAERRMASGWVQAFAQDLMANWRGLMPEVRAETGLNLAERYNVSSVVDNSATKGAPVVFEHSPSFNKLFGYAEDNQKVMMTPAGAMMKKEAPGGPTLKGGSFLKASGGYLVLNLIDVLREPGVYPALMRMVRNGRAEIVDGGIAGLMTGKPSSSYAVPASVKVVFVGSPYLKMLLAHNDEDFGRLFHAVAEFDNSFKIAAETIKGYLRFMREVVTHSTGRMLDFGRDAIAGVLESAAGMAESNEKLTAQFGAVATLMQEASFWAREAGREVVTREDVDKAVSERIERGGSSRRRMKELYGSEVFRVQISGAEVGQNNGLAVVGDFGVPSRITYVAYAQGGDFVVSADQAATTVGPSFLKSLADIKGFMKSTFGKTRPVPVTVSVAFEQQYGGIDGDSATQTMTYGILSALSGVPIKQGIAMTGSMDQKGNVQVIGGVNHKIEGYFDVVTEMLRREGKEMNGEQGIIIPVTNVADLSLRPDIVAAVKAGKFNIWAVSHVGQGVELLTGVPYAEVLRKAEAYINSVRGASNN